MRFPGSNGSFSAVADQIRNLILCGGNEASSSSGCLSEHKRGHCEQERLLHYLIESAYGEIAGPRMGYEWSSTMKT